jgi:hypothetical protein
VDPTLNLEQVKGCLVGRDGSIDCEVFGFDAVIIARDLLKAISKCSSKLHKLLILNSQGACDLDKKLYNIGYIATILTTEECALLQQVMATRNEKEKQSEKYDPDPQEYNQLVSIVLQSRGNLLPRNKKMLCFQVERVTDQKIGTLCKEAHLDFDQVFSAIGRKCTEFKETKIQEAQITDLSNFRCVQTDFLSQLKLENFSSTSIGMYLSESAAGSSYAFDPAVGVKFSQVIDPYLPLAKAEVKTLGTQGAVENSEDFG